MADEIAEESVQEVAGIYAFYGRAFAAGLDSSPSYTSEDVNNFLGYDVEHVLEVLAEKGILEEDPADQMESNVYSMTDEDAKSEALITWKVLRDEFEGSFDKMSLNFGEAQQILKGEDIGYV